MYTFAVFSLMLAGFALSAPQPIALSPEREIAISSAAYGAFTSSTPTTITTTSTVFGTITVTPAATTPPSSNTTSSFSTPVPTTTTAATIPSPEPIEELAGVYICSDVNWSGTCEHKLTPLGSSDEACTQLDGKASSIGPDVGFYCLFFTNSYCRALASDGSDLLTLQYPGVGNLLATENGDWNDRVYSYQCFREEEEGGA